MRQAGGVWVGWSGDAGHRSGSIRGRTGWIWWAWGCPRRGQRLLRGVLQRDPVAAVPRRHRPAGVPPPLVGGVRGGQPVLRGRGGRRGGARRDGLGARLPAAAGAADAARAARRPPHRLLQPHPVPRLRDLRAASVATPGGPGPARRGPARLPEPGRRHELPARLPPGRRPADQGPRHPGAAKPMAAREVHGGVVPHLDRLRGPGGDRPAGRGPGNGPRTSGWPWASRDVLLLGRRPARLHQGHPAPAQRLRRAARRGPARPAGGAGPGRQPEPGAGRGLPRAAGRGRADRRAGSTASTPRWAARRCTTCTSRIPGRRWRRCTWPPTSCWSPRCGTG